MRKNNTVALNILAIFGIFLVVLGLYALSSNITMKRTIGEITYCQKVYDTHDYSNYWDAAAIFSVNG